MSQTSDIQVRLTNGRMQAVLFIPPETGPEFANPDFCRDLAQAEGVLVTPDVAKRIDGIVARHQDDPAAGVEEVIARGTEAVHGEDGHIEWMDGFDPQDDGNILPETADEDGRVDFYNATRSYIGAKEGDHIATIVEPTPGVDGATVDGGAIKAQPGKPFKVRVDDSVLLNPENELIAQKHGLIAYDDRFLRILDLLVIDGFVDFSSGNVDFDGDVVVHKGVRDRFTVQCSGELQVQGLIEAATLIAGGNARFMRGMAAKEKGTIDIKGNLEARYLDNVHGRVRGDLRVEKELCGCFLTVGRGLYIEHGSVVGGLVEIGSEAKIAVLGATGSTQTVLRVGGIPELTESLLKIAEFLPRLGSRIKQVKEDLARLLNSTATPGTLQREMINNLQIELRELTRRRDHLDRKRIEIQAMINHLSTVNVEVLKRLHAGTRFQIGEDQYRIRTDIKGPVRLHYSSSRRPLITDLAGGSSQELEALAEIEPFGAGDENEAAAA